MDYNKNEDDDDFAMHEEGGGLLGPGARERAVSDSGVERNNNKLYAERASSAAPLTPKGKRLVNASNENIERSGSDLGLSDASPSYMLSDGGTRRTKYADILMSPVRYTQRKFRAGGTSGSIFSLVAATLGSGTISFAYAVQQNGIILGIILIILGALISYYTGMLIVKVSNKTQCNRYEDFAQKLYGSRCRWITSFLNLLCLMGFIMSYIVYIKQMLPEILNLFWTVDELPGFIESDGWGQIFWATIFSFIMLFPMSIPRSINALRFSSLFGVLCSLYLSLAVFFVFFCDKDLVPEPSQNFKDANLFDLSFSGVVSSFPLIIFAYMYQVNIPQLYTELEKRDQTQMSKVIMIGTIGAVGLYIVVGVFGYVTWVNYNPGGAAAALSDANILLAPYPNSCIPILIGNFALFFAIATAAPLVVLPAKDTVEEMVARGDPNRRLSKKENLIVTFALIFVSYLLAIVIPNIQSAMTLVGATTNPAVGFILPIIFYWKSIEKDEVPVCSFQKILALTVAIFIVGISLLSLYNWFDTTLG